MFLLHNTYHSIIKYNTDAKLDVTEVGTKRSYLAKIHDRWCGLLPEEPISKEALATKARALRHKWGEPAHKNHKDMESPSVRYRHTVGLIISIVIS